MLGSEKLNLKNDIRRFLRHIYLFEGKKTDEFLINSNRFALHYLNDFFTDEKRAKMCFKSFVCVGCVSRKNK